MVWVKKRLSILWTRILNIVQKTHQMEPAVLCILQYAQLYSIFKDAFRPILKNCTENGLLECPY